MGKISDIIDARLHELGIKGSKMCDDLGISRSTLTELRKGRATTLKAERASAIANYLSISMEELLGEPQKETAPALTDKDRRDVARDVEKIMGDLEHSGDLMFDGVPMSPEAKESMATAMRMGLEMARLKNKETYTPKKYKRMKE